jgi:predicted HicB family RNase H-like nuclease
VGKVTEKQPEVLVRFQLRLPSSLMKDIKEIAENEGRSMNNLIRRILESTCAKTEEKFHDKPLQDMQNEL